jgi:hypothetical protein
MTENEKRAFWGAIGKGLMGGAKMVGGAGLSAAKGMVGFGESAIGAKPLNWVANKGAQAYGTLSGLTGLAGGPGGDFTVNNPLTGNPLIGGAKTGSHLVDSFAKRAFHMSPADMVDAAAYAAFAGSKFVDPHEHPLLHTALDAGALAALAGTTGYGMLSNRDEYKPGLKDLVGLGLMGSALYDRAKAH